MRDDLIDDENDDNELLVLLSGIYVSKYSTVSC